MNQQSAAREPGASEPTAPQGEVVRLGLVGPDEVRRWSAGEVTRAQTYHPRSGRPVPGGLFCEEIFGPLVEWRCRCGHVAGEPSRQQHCRHCGTAVLRRRGRRQNLGHVTLAVPVAHPWFFRARPSPLALLLDLEPGAIEKVIYHEAAIVVHSTLEKLPPGRVLDRLALERARARFGDAFTAQTGAVALEPLLATIDLDNLTARLRLELPGARGRRLLLDRLRLAESLRAGGVRPEWMILHILPVVGPSVRPVVRLGSGRFASSELNDLYRRVLRCNNSLAEAQKDDAPAAIVRELMLALQHAVDALLDNRRARRRVEGPRRPLRSLSDLFTGKQGRFRGHLLGKRVDYSGRSVIVVGPELKLHQCGLPRTMALALFEPLLLGEFLRHGWARTLRRGRQLLEILEHPGKLVDHARLAIAELVRQRQLEHAESTGDHRLQRELDTLEARARGRAALDELPSAAAVDQLRECLRKQGRVAARHRALELLQGRQERLWRLVEQVIAGHPVLLNRAPTLHRLGIQAFEPVLVEGNAIRLHPLVCRAFNADFDGDQMAVHLPLSEEAIAEALTLMTPEANLFNPGNGQLIVTPSQDIVLGCYYLTTHLPGSAGTTATLPDCAGPLPVRTDQGSGGVFASAAEVLLAYELGKLGTHARIRLRHPGGPVLQERGDQEEIEDLPPGRLLDTTAGRVVFNAALPAGLPCCNVTLDARRLAVLLRICRQRLGPRVAVEILDRLKQLGFTHATRSGLSFATADVPHPPEKARALAAARQKTTTLRRVLEEGNIGETDYAAALRETWRMAQSAITEPLRRLLRQDTRQGRPYLNPLHAMVDSKARGSIDQLRQLAGMRGLMASVSGRLIDRPVTASLREGLPSWDYFVSAYGGRKGLTDKGVRTADAGYLTRKLVACCQQVLVTMADCQTTLGVTRHVPPGTLASRVEGRVSCETVHDELGGEVIREGELISPGQARQLAELDRRQLHIRSPLTCQAPFGVCQRCYGLDLGTHRLVEVGTAVGIIAAQAIGEPGTQLTLRTFHTGGEAGKDIVNDLERVTRLLEAAPPAHPALLAPAAGILTLHEYGPEEPPAPVRGWWLHREIDTEESPRLSWRGHALRVRQGMRVEPGSILTEGDVDLRQLLALAGPAACAEYLLGQVRELYRTHALVIDDRHLEVVLARMLGYVRVTAAGDTTLVPGQVLPRATFRELLQTLPPGRTPPRVRPWLLGVSQAAAWGESFLAAAGFQRAVQVLTGAALAGRTDRLTGLMENVILGRRIPVRATVTVGAGR